MAWHGMAMCQSEDIGGIMDISSYGINISVKVGFERFPSLCNTYHLPSHFHDKPVPSPSLLRSCCSPLLTPSIRDFLLFILTSTSFTIHPLLPLGPLLLPFPFSRNSECLPHHVLNLHFPSLPLLRSLSLLPTGFPIQLLFLHLVSFPFLLLVHLLSCCFHRAFT